MEIGYGTDTWYTLRKHPAALWPGLPTSYGFYGLLVFRTVLTFSLNIPKKIRSPVINLKIYLLKVHKNYGYLKKGSDSSKSVFTVPNIEKKKFGSNSSNNLSLSSDLFIIIHYEKQTENLPSNKVFVLTYSSTGFTTWKQLVHR